jgi:hypothetical protein
MPRPLAAALLALLGAPVVAATGSADKAPPVPAPHGDQAVPFAVKLERAAQLYRVQGERQPDHEVKDAIKIGGLEIPARIEKGQLELDLARDGKFKPAKGPVTVSLPKADGKGATKLEILVSKAADGSWQYRTLTQLSAQIGSERLAFVDVDGDGTFNEPGIDAVLLAGRDYAFPLPAAGERWSLGPFDLTGLSFGALGEAPKVVGRALATTVPDALAVLKGVDEQRLLYGLTPRAEETTLSAGLQKHCHYMVGTGKLAHPEDRATPGYSDEGNTAGMNSILSNGTPAEAVAAQMVNTFYHRQDVLRPNTQAFGVGYEGRFGGIDGRRSLGGSPSWPVLVPAPGQYETPVRFAPEMPDPIGGDHDAGFPITAYFGSDNLKLSSWKLEALSDKGPASAVDCYVFDSSTGGEVTFNRFQRVVGLIAKDPLQPATHYRVTLAVDVGGSPWKQTWEFATVGAKRPAGP